jgi:hypothetical protein
MFNRVKFVLSKRISQNKGYFIDGKKKLNNIKKTSREFSTNVQPSPNGGDNFLKVLLVCGIVFVANSSEPPPSAEPYYFDWTSV